MSKSKSRPPLGPRHRTKEAAKYMGVAESTLEKKRVAGTGPEFEKVGKIVVYSEQALEDYLEQRRARSTSEAETLNTRLSRRQGNRSDPANLPNSAARAMRRRDGPRRRGGAVNDQLNPTEREDLSADTPKGLDDEGTK
jgi:hypothetical protein